jgi:hypothetical protein
MDSDDRIPGIPRIPQIPKEPEAVTPAPLPTVYVREPPAWEYKHIACKLNEEAVLNEVEMNALGADGWELAGVSTDAASVHFYFKRLTRA